MRSASPADCDSHPRAAGLRPDSLDFTIENWRKRGIPSAAAGQEPGGARGPIADWRL